MEASRITTGPGPLGARRPNGGYPGACTVRQDGRSNAMVDGAASARAWSDESGGTRLRGGGRATRGGDTEARTPGALTDP
jgi:hypothetical protein